MKKEKNSKIGYTAALLSAICFGSSGLFVKYVYNTGLTAGEMLILQYLLAIVILWGGSFLYFRKKIFVSKRIFYKLVVLGVFGNTFMTLFYYKSFRYLDVAIATILLFTYPIIVSIYSIIFTDKKINRATIICLLSAFLGSFLVLNLINYEDTVSMVGIFFGLLGAVFYAFMNIYSESFLEDVEPFIVTTYVNTFSLITLLSLYQPFHLISSPPAVETWVVIVILAMVAGVLPVFLLYTGIKNIGAVKASIIANFEIPVSALLSYFIYHEVLNALQIIGMVLVIISIMILQKKEQK
jgi:drug/metabolite transporter (DMT)-like permease